MKSCMLAAHVKKNWPGRSNLKQQRQLAQRYEWARRCNRPCIPDACVKRRNSLRSCICFSSRSVLHFSSSASRRPCACL